MFAVITKTKDGKEEVSRQNSPEAAMQLMATGGLAVYNVEKSMYNALKVITLTPKIKEWLAANDPKALEQVEKAIWLFE
jgi:hypothetical protein